MGPLLFACALLQLGEGSGEARAGHWPESGPTSAGPRLAPESVAEGVSFGALLRAFYSASAAEAAPAGAEDVAGVVLEDVDAYLSFDGRDVAWRLSAELEGGELALEDAHARWQHLDWLALAAGRFKPRVLRSASVPPDALLFRERTFLGAVFDGWDEGLELGGHYDQFDYWLSLTDVSDGGSSDHFWSARAEWALFDAAFEDLEGARGAPDHLQVLLGCAWFADGALTSREGGGFGADVALRLGPYSLHGEWADLDEGFERPIDVFNGLLLDLGAGQPAAITFGARLGADAEAALRYQRAGDSLSTESFGGVLQWSPGGGPARCVADVALVESDPRDFALFSLGLGLGSSGLVRPFTRSAF